MNASKNTPSHTLFENLELRIRELETKLEAYKDKDLELRIRELEIWLAVYNEKHNDLVVDIACLLHDMGAGVDLQESARKIVQDEHSLVEIFRTLFGMNTKTSTTPSSPLTPSEIYGPTP